MNKTGGYFVSFAPAVSSNAQKAMREAMHEWRLAHRTDTTLEEIARRINPIVRGWIQYYGQFYRSEMREVLDHLNWLLSQWVRRKFKKYRHQRRAMHWLGRIARLQPALFAHWQMGAIPAGG